MRNLILTGGIGHDFADAASALANLLRDTAIESTITQDIEGGLRELAAGGFGLVTVYALRWRMLTGEKYAPHRAAWAFSLSEAGRQALTGFVERGGGLLALHTAVICFDDWAGWKALVGGQWRWGRSSHPPLGPVEAVPTAAPHPVTAGAAPFTLRDEVYGDLDMLPEIEPLMAADAGAGERPVLWAREIGLGRVVTDLFGHDRAALEQPMHRRILCRAAHWLARDPMP